MSRKYIASYIVWMFSFFVCFFDTEVLYCSKLQFHGLLISLNYDLMHQSIDSTEYSRLSLNRMNIAGDFKGLT
mgnify:CR=1 FL=1